VKQYFVKAKAEPAVEVRVLVVDEGLELLHVKPGQPALAQKRKQPLVACV